MEKIIVLASHNKGKIREFQKILEPFGYVVKTAADFGHTEEPVEDGKTYQENAYIKAKYYHDALKMPVISDDSGIEIEALGEHYPGVHSARYAEGTDHDSNANMDKLLRKLGDETHRSARFRTVIALLQKQQSGESAGEGSVLHIFEGKVEGSIIKEKRGAEGFGYDPIFMPEGYDKTFAELGLDVKNQISHRARAVKKLADYLL